MTKSRNRESKKGKGGELHQVAKKDEPVLTTQQGVPVADHQTH